MPKAKSQPLTKILPCTPQSNAQDESEVSYVKIIVFDDQNRILVVKNKNRFVLPGGRVEWDDDDAESAARREVFEAANIALGLVQPVTVIQTQDHEKQITKTSIFAARMSGEPQVSQHHKNTHRFVRKESFLEALHQNELVHTLIDAGLRVLTSEEIREDRDQTTLRGQEKYNAQSLL